MITLKQNKIKKLLGQTLNTYFLNIKLFFIASIPLFILYFITLNIQNSTFPSMGGVFIRTSSIDEISGFDFVILSLFFLISTFIVSSVITFITLIIKVKKQNTKIESTVLDNLNKYIMDIFGILITMELLFFITGLLGFYFSSQNLMTPALNFIISLIFLYVPYAIILSDLSIINSLKTSIFTIYEKAKETLFLLIFISFLLFVFQIILLYFPFGQYLLMAVINIFLVPITLILASQIYLSRYSIIN